MRIRFGRFVLQTGSRQLFRDGDEVHLSPKAFDLLHLLVAGRPSVLTKQELFGRLWPDTFVVEANLNVLVAELRRALDDDARAPRFIRTAHGVGYAFSGEAVDEPASAATPDSGPWLEGEGRAYPLTRGDNIIGRDPRCTVYLNDSSVSRRHARIRIPEEAGPAMLEDLGSTNGTFVGRRRLGSAASLSDGDRVKFGNVELRFRSGPDNLSPTRRVRRR